MAVYKQCITGVSPIRVSAAYPAYSDGSYHGGIDTVHKDHKAYAPMAGTIVTAHKWQGGTTGNDSWGNYIVIKMSDNSYWLAAHFAQQIHSVGETITRGQFIGQQGQTGNASGIHTHWEYWVGGYGTANRTDPSAILGIPNQVGTWEVEWDAGGEPGPGPGPGPGPWPTGKLPVWLLFKMAKGGKLL